MESAFFEKKTGRHLEKKKSSHAYPTYGCQYLGKRRNKKTACPPAGGYPQEVRCYQKADGFFPKKPAGNCPDDLEAPSHEGK